MQNCDFDCVNCGKIVLFNLAFKIKVKNAHHFNTVALIGTVHSLIWLCQKSELGASTERFEGYAKFSLLNAMYSCIFDSNACPPN